VDATLPSTTRLLSETWMVAAEAPRPRLRTARFAEDPQVEHSGITPALAPKLRREPFRPVQNVLQPHHRSNVTNPDSDRPVATSRIAICCCAGSILAMGARRGS
jgi:hypothetical protein